MKLVSFHARDVYGYLRFDLEFLSSLTILVGPNGSGKTTALRLIQALLTPSIQELITIDFSSARLTFENQGIQGNIEATKSNDFLQIRLSGLDATAEIPLAVLDEVEAELAPHRLESETLRALQVRFGGDPVLSAIASLGAPLFLGLDRRQNAVSDDGVWDVRIAQNLSRRQQGRRIARSSLTANIFETQQMVLNAFRRVRRLQDQASEQLRHQLILSGFRYVPAETFEAKRLEAALGGLFGTESSIRRQKEALETALAKIGVPDSEVRKTLDPVFEQISELVRKLGTGSDVERNQSAFFELLVNQSSLDRLQDIITLVKKFEASQAGLLGRFDQFVACINSFFQDSRKTIEIDPVGAVVIVRPDKTTAPIEALSSGERQIVIMVAHLFFSSFGARSAVFVVDEPELSLHLRWQELLLDKMVESNPRAQIVIATHSPEIVGERKDACVQV